MVPVTPFQAINTVWPLIMEARNRVSASGLKTVSVH